MADDEIVLVVIGLGVCIPAALFWLARICMRSALDCLIDEGDLQ